MKARNRLTGLHAIALAALVAALALLVPLPSWIIDGLVAANLAFSIAVFVLALTARRPLELQELPAMLVASSIGRVFLALAIGRAILTHHSGGAIVASLGAAASTPGPVAGVASVVMVALIDLLVIAVGMVRVSEVLARFALDALPGRQMGIDTAISAGHMTSEEAVVRQADIDREAAFYGAMDGAARFLRGDCLATLVIVGVTAVAGALSGSASAGAYLPGAAGHGLAVLVPAVFVGAAGAIILSRAGTTGEFGLKIAGQLIAQPLVLGVAAVTLLSLAIVSPGARLPLVVTAGVMAALVIVGSRFSTAGEPREADMPEAQSANRIEIGLGLTGHFDIARLRDRITTMRREFENWAGFAIDPFVIRDNSDLSINEVGVVLNDQMIVQCTIRPGRTLALGGDWEAIEGATPARLGARKVGAWIPDDQFDQAHQLPVRLLDPAGALVWACSEIVRANAGELFDAQRASEVIQRVAESHPAVVEAAESRGVDAVRLSEMGGHLLAEGVPLRNGAALLEALAQGVQQGASEDDIAAAARNKLSRAICQTAAPDGVIMALEIAPDLASELSTNLMDRAPSFGGQQASRWMEVLGHWERESIRIDHPITLMCDRQLRAPVQKMLSDLGCNLMTMSAEEVEADFSVQILHVIERAEIEQTGQLVEE
ncbi:MAG: FHIPEP family type III secretion protein [Armatimonadota bacterium]